MSSDQTSTQDPEYKLEEQIGFLLRVASQRHGAIFQTNIDGKLTPTQFSTLIRLAEFGAVSQNRLGRLASMDIATIKGVVDRLKAKGLIQTEPDLVDKRRSVITLSPRGAEMIAELRLAGAKISQETLAPLSKKEQNTLLKLLNKIS